MKNNKKIFSIAAASLLLASCSDQVMEWRNPDGTVGPEELPLELQEKINRYDFIKNYMKEYHPGVDITVGMGLDNFLGDETYQQTVLDNFMGVTFGNAMKHQSVVKNNGSYDWSTVDKFIAGNHDLKLHGHNLLWHTQQNQNYLYTLIAPEAVVEGESDIANLLSGDSFDFNGATHGNWWTNLADTEEFVQPGHGDDGGYAWKLTVPTDGQMHEQQAVYTFDAPMTEGATYKLRFYAKYAPLADEAGTAAVKYSRAGAASTVQTILQNSSYSAVGGYHQHEIGSDWTLVEQEWTLDADDASKVTLQFGSQAGYYYFDNVEFGLKQDVVKDPMENVLFNDNSTFEGGTKGDWGSWGGSSSSEVVSPGYESEYCLALTTPEDGSDYYVCQAGLTFNAPFTPGTYIISFMARSEGAGGVQVAYQNSSTYAGGGYHAFDLTTDWIPCEYEWTITEDDMNRILISFGKTAGTYYIDNIKFGLKIGDDSGDNSGSGDSGNTPGGDDNGDDDNNGGNTPGGDDNGDDDNNGGDTPGGDGGDDNGDDTNSDPMDNILPSWESDFETGTKGGWGSYGNSSSSSVVQPGHDSDYCVELINPSSSNAWDAQFFKDFDENPLEQNVAYIIMFDAKSTVDNGYLQFQYQNHNDYGSQGGYNDFTIGTDWATYQHEFTITNETYTNVNRIILNFGKVEGSYYIDNIKFGKKKAATFSATKKAVKTNSKVLRWQNKTKVDLNAAKAMAAASRIGSRAASVTYKAKTEEEKATALLAAMEDWIRENMEHVGKHASSWDVINEPIGDDSKFRGIDGGWMSGDSKPVETETDGLKLNWANDAGNGHFYWGYYIGMDYAVKAFEYARKYAEQINPDIKLFVNDYNLEVSPSKLAKLIEFVNYIDQNGAHVDGIGTQMHVSGTSITKEQVDAMFQTLAATGKLIRITELDVAMGTASPSVEQQQLQADVYQMILTSYFENIPEDQQSGITIWSLTDNAKEHEYWLNGDTPNIFDAQYGRKIAYKGVCDAIIGRDISLEWQSTDWSKAN